MQFKKKKKSLGRSCGIDQAWREALRKPQQAVSRSDKKVLPREEYQRTAQRGQSGVSCELRPEGKKEGETARTGGLFLGCPGAVPQTRHLQSTKKSDICQKDVNSTGTY